MPSVTNRVEKNYQSLLLFAAGVVVLVLFLWIVMHNGAFSGFVSPASGSGTVYFGNTAVSVEVESTPAAREQGLSGRVSLPAGHGMLFVFDSDYPWGFWMKDMNFPIDIIWADSSGRVVTVLPSVSPETYNTSPPQTFKPSLPARYVLEVPAGFAAANNIYEGVQMSFSTSTPR